MKKIFLSALVLAFLASAAIFAADSGAVTEGEQSWAGRKILLKDAITDSTLTGAVTVDGSYTTTLRMDPGGASRNVTLDATLNKPGYHFKFINSADAAENLVIKNSAGTTIVTIGQNEAGEVFFGTGVTWYGYAYSNASSGFIAAAGTTTGATSQAQTFTNGVVLDSITGNTATTLAIAAKVGASAAGNPVTVTGGAGNGAFAGGAASLVGGASGAGATGNGADANVTGGAALSTNGSGGSVVLTPGVKTGTGIAGGTFLRSATAMHFKQLASPGAGADQNETLTAAQLINGIYVHTIATGRTLTTPTGADITAGCPASIATGDCFEFTLITVGAGADDISTLTAGDGNVTFVGDVTVGPVSTTTRSSGTWIFRKTGASTWVGYRKN